MKAFERANSLADNARLEHIAGHFELGVIARDALDGLKSPVVNHGTDANRFALATVA